MKKITTQDILTTSRTKARSGYVLLATLMLIALGIGVISTVVQRALNYQRIMRVALDREKARMLALGGIQLALAQVSFVHEDKQEQEQKKQQDQNQEQDQEHKENQAEKAAQEPSKLNAEQRWLLQLLPVVNTWQQFAFNQDKDKLEGALRLHISSEQGKFDLASLLDVSPESHKITGEQQLPTAEPTISKNQNAPSDTQSAVPRAQINKDTSKDKKEKEHLKAFVNEQLSKRLSDIKIIDVAQKIQKQLGRKLEDPTELVHNKQVQEVFQNKLFVQESKQENKDDKTPVYLTDIFTTRSRSGKLNPWLISSSVSTLIEFQDKDKSDMQKWQQAVKQWQPKINWASAWDKIFKDIYGKAYQALPQALRDNLNPEFEATAFLVISSATVGTVTQTVAALVQKSDFLSQSNTQHSGGSGFFGLIRQPRMQQLRIFAPTKLYWL